MSLQTQEEDTAVRGGLDDIPVFDQSGNRINEPTASAAGNNSSHNDYLYEKKSTIVTIPPETTLAAEDPGVGEPIGTIPIGNALEVTAPALPGMRQAHICCGCFCDCRRAVLVVNSIGLCLSFAFLVIAAVQHMNAGLIAEEESYTFLALRQQSTSLIIMMATGIIFHGFGMMGAIRYNVPMVTAALTWYCVDIGLCLWSLNLLDAVISAAFSYPHFVLIREIKLGILTPDNYPDQRHSCCCM